MTAPGRPNEGPIVGIDLGTTHSLISIWRDGRSELIPNALGEFLTPSAVSLDDDGRWLIGRPALERLQTHPERSACLFKRSMGTAKTYHLGPDRTWRAEELSAMVLRALKADAEAVLKQSIHAAVITVPAYFSEIQRNATRQAGQLAGFSEVSLLNEPTAAALAYGLHQQQEQTQFLVFDLGGGTFDVSVLEMFEGVMEVRATSGDNHLGGEDVDEALEAWVLQKISPPTSQLQSAHWRAALRQRIRDAKHRLAYEPLATIQIAVGEQMHTLNLAAEELESTIQLILARLRAPVERALRDARIASNELDAVVLAGGSTRLQPVRQMVTRLFGRFPQTALNPDEIVALGAAVQAGLKARDSDLRERVMTDVCPYSLGIETSKQFRLGHYTTGFMAPIIERNTVIPVSRVRRFYPIEDGQQRLRIEVYQGEGRRVQDNIRLGELDLALPAGSKESVAADIRFTYDASGLLEVDAQSLKEGAPWGVNKRLIIQSSAERMSDEEVSRRLKAMEALKIHPRDRLPERTLMARAERHHLQLLGPTREDLSDLMSQFELALESQDEKQIAMMRASLESALTALEGWNPFQGE